MSLFKMLMDSCHSVPVSRAVNQSEPALINRVASTIDEASIRAIEFRMRKAQTHEHTGQKRYTLRICMFRFNHGGQAEAVEVSCIKLSCSTLDLCNQNMYNKPLVNLKHFQVLMHWHP